MLIIILINLCEEENTNLNNRINLINLKNSMNIRHFIKSFTQYYGTVTSTLIVVSLLNFNKYI